MKANILKTLLAVVALIIGATACDDKGYWEPYNPEGVQYSFVTPDVIVEFPTKVPVEERIITIPVRRSTKEGDAVINLGIKPVDNLGLYDPAEIFECPESVTFKDGENVQEIVINFKGTRRGYIYACKLSFTDQVSPGGFNAVSITATLKR